MTDYVVNLRAIISSFYVGTGGLDIGLMHSAQGIAGGENWEKPFTKFSPIVCKAIINIVDKIIEENLKEEIELTIADKVKGKYTASEIKSLTQKYLITLQQELIR